MIRFILIISFYLISNTCLATPPHWKEKLIQVTQEELLKIKKNNLKNDLLGRSEQNNYVVHITTELIFPDAEYIKQRKGVGRGEEDFILNQPQLDSLNEVLRTVNKIHDLQNYVLIINYIPLEFNESLPEKLTVAELFGLQKQSINDVVAKAKEQSANIIKDIITPFLSTENKPTLYSGLVKYQVFESEMEQKTFWTYTPYNKNIEHLDNFKRMVSSSIARTEGAKNDAGNVKRVINLIRRNANEYIELKNIVVNLNTINSVDELKKELGKLSINGLAGLDIHHRIHALKVLSSVSIPNDSEILINNILATVNTPTDADLILAAFDQPNDKVPPTLTVTTRGSAVTITNHKVNWCLLQCISSETHDGFFPWSDDNYLKLMINIIKICYQSSSFSKKVAQLGEIENVDLLSQRMITFNYNSIWKKAKNTFAPEISTETKSSFENCTINTHQQYFFSYLLPLPYVTGSHAELNPLDPIIFINESKLGMLAALDNIGVIALPAIVLKYADDKAYNKTAMDISILVADVASLAIGIGELKAGVNALRATWAILDMTNSGINLTVNASGIAENPEAMKMVNAYNLLTGGITLSGAGATAVRSVYRNVRNINNGVLDLINIKNFIAQINDCSDDALRAMPNQHLSNFEKVLERVKLEAGARGATTLEETAAKALDRVSKRIREIEVVSNAGNDLLTFVNKSLSQKLDDIKGIWNTKYPVQEMLEGRSFFEDIMGQYRYLKSSGWSHTGDISEFFKGVDFYKGSTQGTNIFAETAVSMKTTITTNVDNWLASAPIQKNIGFLEDGLDLAKGLSSNGKTMRITNAEIHIYMPKANITDALKTTWMTKLNTVNPKIKFEIKALEDFVN